MREINIIDILDKEIDSKKNNDEKFANIIFERMKVILKLENDILGFTLNFKNIEVESTIFFEKLINLMQKKLDGDYKLTISNADIVTLNSFKKAISKTKVSFEMKK